VDCLVVGGVLFAFHEGGEDQQGGLPHGPGFEGEGDEADEAGEGHFEVFVVFVLAEEGEVVDPFGEGPEVPEFPEEAAEESGEAEGESAAEAALLPVAEDGGAAGEKIDGIEESPRADPDGEVGGGGADEDRDGGEKDTEDEDESGEEEGFSIFHFRFSIETVEAEALEGFGGEEHSGGDGAEGDEIAEEAVGECGRQVEVFPGAEAGVGVAHEIEVHPVEIAPGGDGPEPADGEAIAEADEVGAIVEEA